jgi:hypothetical protein
MKPGHVELWYLLQMYATARKRASLNVFFAIEPTVGIASPCFRSPRAPNISGWRHLQA